MVQKVRPIVTGQYTVLFAMPRVTMVKPTWVYRKGKYCTGCTVGKLNGWPVKVLRDTGCTGMIMDRALVHEVMVIPGSSGSLQMVDHMLIDVPLASINLDSPYYKGHRRVMCVSSPVYPVIIGNVRGARRMLPDPDW